MSERYSRHDDPCADHYDTPDSTEAYEPRYYQGTDLRAVALEVSAALRALDLPNMRFYGTDAEDIAGVLRLSEHFDYENPGFGSLELRHKRGATPDSRQLDAPRARHRPALYPRQRRGTAPIRG
jgi:hypothetical protein